MSLTCWISSCKVVDVSVYIYIYIYQTFHYTFSKSCSLERAFQQYKASVITQWNGIFLEKLTKPHILNKSSVYCENPHFLSRSQPRHWTLFWASYIQSVSSHSFCSISILIWNDFYAHRHHNCSVPLMASNIGQYVFRRFTLGMLATCLSHFNQLALMIDKSAQIPFFAPRFVV